MARYLLLPLILLLALAGLLFWIGNEPKIIIAAMDYKPVELSLQIVIVGIVGTIAGIILLWSLSRWLWQLPRRMKTGFSRKRAGQGLDALEQAMLAGEAGDGTRARKKAQKAHELLGRPALTGLINAKTAESAGDLDAAQSLYEQLLDKPETALAGRRGLGRIYQLLGRHSDIIAIAKTAFADGKGPKWAFDDLFKAQIQGADWDGALETMERAGERKLLERGQIRRTRAAILAAKAFEYDQSGNAAGAIDMARRAAELSPSFAPASVLAARLLAIDGHAKTAAQLIEKAWSKAPHPALAIAHQDIYAGESDKFKAGKLKTLVKQNPGHRESALLLAARALEKKDGTGALSAMGALLRSEDPSARLCMLASAAETMLGNPIDARTWQIRAASAPLEADWSDLDPEGSDFNYTQEDWQRMIVSYGETGTLIHPRLKAGQRRRAAIKAPIEAPSADSNTKEDQYPNFDAGDAPASQPELSVQKTKLAPKPAHSDTPPRPDDPGVLDEAGGDLSERLDKLLDTKNSD